MKPFFSLITPTLQRESLLRCCESVDIQNFPCWEHIVCVDGRYAHAEILDKLSQNSRAVMFTQPSHKWGNLQRFAAWERATGEYLVMLDDDNTLAHPGALADIYEALESENFPEWALFPIMRHGSRFLILPPGMCMTDTANIVVKREIGRWPEIEAREADGVLAERLKAEYPYIAFPHVQPIVLMEKSSDGI